MGISIGELFVSLGFDVDDKKLKEFNDGIKTTLNNVLSLAGITASVAGFAHLLNSAADTATVLHNLSAEFGANQKAAQGWAAALHEANPLVSYTEGLNSYRKIAEYIRDMQSGKNAGTALGAFGGSLEDNTPEKVIARLRNGLQNTISQYGVGRTSQWIDEITGGVSAINVLTESVEKYNEVAAKGIVDQKQLDDLARYNHAIADLGNSFDQLKAKWLSMPAEAIARWLGEIDKKGVLGGISEASGFNLFQRYAAQHGYLAAIGRTTDVLGAVNPYHLPTPGAGRKIASDASGRMIGILTAMGWSPEQAQGMVARLGIESGLNPNAVGDGGSAYGIAQWHPDRQAAFKSWAGKDIRQSTLDEQLQFMNYELTQGNEQRAGRLLRQTGSAQEAQDVFTKNYERPSVTVNATMHITGDNPREIGHEVASSLQQMINSTYSQTDLGAVR